MGIKGRIKKEKKPKKKRDNTKHRELVEIGSQWLLKETVNWKYKCQFVCPELVCQGGVEDPDIFGLKPDGHVLIEVKVSRADFLRDKKKRARQDNRKQLGSYRFYLVPTGIITVDDLPDGWGLLEWDNENVNLIKESEHFDENFHDAGYFYHSILRRLFKPAEFNFRKPELIMERLKK